MPEEKQYPAAQIYDAIERVMELPSQISDVFLEKMLGHVEQDGHLTPSQLKKQFEEGLSAFRGDEDTLPDGVISDFSQALTDIVIQVKIEGLEKGYEPPLFDY